MILRLKDENGFWKEVSALQGPKGEPGPQGPKGDSVSNAVLYTPQFLSEEEKAQVRENIGVDESTSGGSGGPVFWDKVKNKPFEEISSGQSFFWDGNTENLPYEEIEIDVGSDAPVVLTYCKISDIILSEDDAKKSKVSFLSRNGDDLETVSLPINTIKGKTSNGSFYATHSGSPIPLLIICNSAGDTIEDNIYGIDLSITFPEEGMWFFKKTYYGEEQMRVTSLIIPPEIKTLDSKYLPDGCAGREIGTKILWDGAPTDTYIQPGWVIEWDGSDTGVSCSIIAGPNSEMEVPEGAAFYKISEKLDSLVGLVFEFGGGSIHLDSDSVLTYFDENDGQIIATYGSPTMQFVWNVEKPGKVMVQGNEAVFEEEGLYFLKTSDKYWVERIYNELYGEMEDLKLYKISEPINDTLDGYILNLLNGDNEEMELPLSSGNFLFGQTETGSSYAFPYFFNIKTDNEKINIMAETDISLNFEKAGLYLVDFSTIGATFNFLAGRDYQIFKINKKFLPDSVSDKYKTYIENSDDIYPTSGAVYRALGNRSQLLIQSSINLSSNDPVSSNAVYKALGNRTELSIRSSINSWSEDPVSSSAVYQGLKTINEYLSDDDYSNTDYTSLRYRGSNLRPISQENSYNPGKNGTILWFYE